MTRPLVSVFRRSAISTASIRPREDIARGILYICASVILSAVMGVGIKWLSDTYPAVELTFFRSFFGLIPTLAFVRRAGGVGTLRTQRPGSHFLRAAAWVISFLCSFLSLHYLTLATSVAFSFLAPLFMTVLSVPMLGEYVGIHRWAAVILGLALPFFWTPPSWQGLLLMAGLGLLGGISQFWTTQALSYAPAAAVAPFNYTQMIWAVIFGFIVWGDLPTLNLMIGVALVVASGLYILHRETRRRRSDLPPPPVQNSRELRDLANQGKIDAAGLADERDDESR